MWNNRLPAMKWRQKLPAILFVLTLQVFLAGSQGQFNLHMLRRHLNARRPFPQHVPNNRFQNFNPQQLLARGGAINSSPRFPVPNLLPRGTPQLQPGSVQPTFPGSNAAALPQINRSWQPAQQQNIQSAQIPQTNQNLQNSQSNPLPNSISNPNLVQKQIHEFHRLQMMLRHIKQQKERQQLQQQQQQQRRQQLIQQIQAIQRARTLQGANARVAGSAHVAKINQMEKMIRDMIKYRDQLKRQAAFRQKTRQVTVSNKSNREQISTADVQSGPSILIMDKNTVTEIPILTTKKPNASLGQNMIVFAKTANIHSNVDLQHNKGVELKTNQQSLPRQQQQNEVTTPQPVAYQNNIQHTDNHFKGHHPSNSHSASSRIQQQQQHQEVSQKITSDVLGNIFEKHPQGNTQPANLHSQQKQRPHRQTLHELMTEKQHIANPQNNPRNPNARNIMQNANIPSSPPKNFNRIKSTIKGNQQHHNSHQNLNPMWEQNHNPNVHVSSSSNHHNNGPGTVNGHQTRKTSHGSIKTNTQHLTQIQHIPQRATNVRRNSPTQLDLPPLGMIPDQLIQSQNNIHPPTTLPSNAMLSVGSQQPEMQSSSNHHRSSLGRQNIGHENRIYTQSQQNTNQITTPMNRGINPNPYNKRSNIRFTVTTVMPQTWERKVQGGQQSKHFQPTTTTASNPQIANVMHRSSNNHPQRINRQLFKRPPRPSTPPTATENRHGNFIRHGQQSKFHPRIKQQILQTSSPVVGNPPRQFVPTTLPSIPTTTPRPSFNDYFNQIPRSSPRKVKINFRKPARQQTNLSIMTPPPIIPTQPNYPPPPTQVPAPMHLPELLPTLPPPHRNLEQVPHFQMKQANQRSPRQNITPPPLVPTQPNYPHTTEVPSPQYPQHLPTIPPPPPSPERKFQTKQINQQSVRQQVNTIEPNIRYFTTTKSPMIYHAQRKSQSVNHGKVPFSGVSNNKNINQNQIANANNNHLPQTIPTEVQQSEIQKWKSEMRISNPNSNHQSGSSNLNFHTSLPPTTTEKPKVITPRQRNENPLAKLLRLLQRKAPSIKFASERHNQQRPQQVKKSHSRRNQRRPTRPSMIRPTQIPFTGLPFRPKPNSFPFNSHTSAPLPRPTDVPRTNRWSSRTMPPVVPTTLKSMPFNSKRFDISPFSSFPVTRPNRRPQPTSLPFVQTSAPKPTPIPVRSNVHSIKQITSRSRSVQHRKQNINHNVNNVNLKRRKNTRINGVNPAQLLIAALIQALQNGNLLKQLQLRQQNNQHPSHNSEPQVPQQHSNIKQHHEQGPRNDQQTSMNMPYQNTIDQMVPATDHHTHQQLERHQQVHENHNMNHPQVMQYNPDTQTNPPKDMPDLSMLQGQEIEFTNVNTGFGGDSPPPVIIQRIPKKSRSRHNNNFNGNSNGVPYEFPTMALHENSAVVVDTSIQTPTIDNDDLSNSTSELNETNQSIDHSSHNESVTNDISRIIEQEQPKQVIESSMKSETTTPLAVVRKIELPDSDKEPTEENQNVNELDKGLNTISDSKNENEDDKNMSHLELPSMSPMLPEYDFPDLGTPPPLFMTKKDHITTDHNLNDNENNLDSIAHVNRELMLPVSHDIKDDTTTAATTTTPSPTTTTNPTTPFTSDVQTKESFVNNVTTTASPKTTLLSTTSLMTGKTEGDVEFESLSTKSSLTTKETTLSQIEDEDHFTTTTSTTSTSKVPELKSTTMSPITSSTTNAPTYTTTTTTAMPTVAITFPAGKKSTAPLVITTESLPATISRSSTNSPTTLGIKTTTETITEKPLAHSRINANMLPGVSDDHISDSETFTYTTPFPMFHENMDYRNIFPEMFGLKPVHIIPTTTRKPDMTTGSIPSTSTSIPSSSMTYQKLHPNIFGHTIMPKIHSENEKTTLSPPQTTTLPQTTTKTSTTESKTSETAMTTATTTFITTPSIFLTSVAYRDLFPELFGRKPDRQVNAVEGSAKDSFTTRPTTKITTTTTALPTTTPTKTTTTSASTTSTTTIKTTTKPSTTTPKPATTIPSTTTTTTVKPYIEERRHTMPTKDYSFTLPTTIDYRDLFPEMFGRKPLPHIYDTKESVVKQFNTPTTAKPIIETTWSPPVQKTYVGQSLEDSRLHREATVLSPTSSSYKTNNIDSSLKEPSNVKTVKKSPEFFVSNNLNGGKLRPQEVRSTTPRTVRVLGRDIVVRTTAQSLSGNYASGNGQSNENTANKFTDIVQHSKAGQLSQLNVVQPTPVVQHTFNNAISQESKPQAHFDVVDIPYDPHLDRAATLLSGSKIPNQYHEAATEEAVQIQEAVENTLPKQSENFIDLSSFSTNSLAANPALPQESNSMNDVADVSTQLDTLLSALGSDIMIHEQKSNDGHVQYKIQGGNKDLPVFVLRTGYRWTETIG